MSLFLADRTEWTAAEIAQVVREQLACHENGDTWSGQLRSAVMYCPYTMPAKDFIKACEANGLHGGSARNRYNEVRAWQKEMGEI